MHKVNGPGATPQNDFTAGDPATALAATEVTAAWLNSVQGELVSLIELEGGVLDPNDDAQVHATIAAMILAATPVIPASFDVGTSMVFYQSAAPTGWTKDTTAGLDKAGLRIVTATAWAAGQSGTEDPFLAHTHTTSATALSTAQLASHNHTYNSPTIGGVYVASAGATGGGVGSTGWSGSGTTHTHGATAANTAPKFVNMIIAVKN